MWYVIQVKTNEEKSIARKLQEHGLKAVVPLENRPIRKGGTWTTQEYVLFPSYIFLNIIYNAENYYRVKGMPGVIRFLGDTRYPATLSYLEAEWIIALAGGGKPIEPALVHEVDNQLVIVDGVLKRFEGQIQKIDKRSRKALVKITICNEEKEVQLGIRLDDKAETEQEADE